MFGNVMVNPSNVQHDFSLVPHADIPRSTFRRDHNYKTTLEPDYLIPIYADEALPGDTFNVRLSAVIRLNTPLFPLMDNIRANYFFFSVPNRLLWNNWKRFMGERDPDPDSSIDYTVPVIDCPSGGWTEESLGDYMGIPIGIDNISVNALHFRAYNLIWNSWFRSQDLQDSVTVDLDDGPDDPADYVLLKRNKRFDYFTSCLPWPVKQGVSVPLPLGESADVLGIGGVGQVYSDSSVTAYESDGGSRVYAHAYKTDASNAFYIEGDAASGGYPMIYADLNTATAASINSLREAFQLQKLLERDARAGTRYIEQVKGHFGISSPDLRAQRPEYLGGGTAPVIVQPIPQTNNLITTPVGHLAAIGFSNSSGIGFTKSFTEHCTVLGFVNIDCDINYQRGINRMWKRQTRYDFYFPVLAHLGEQEVLNQEIYLKDGTIDTDSDGTPDNEEVFGYNERWSEYHYFPSIVSGYMRSDSSTPLDAWHLAQDFGVTAPELNSAFIQQNMPIDRVVWDSDDSSFRFDGYFKILATRPMPLYSVPGLIDHF